MSPCCVFFSVNTIGNPPLYFLKKRDTPVETTCKFTVLNRHLSVTATKKQNSQSCNTPPKKAATNPVINRPQFSFTCISVDTTHHFSPRKHHEKVGGVKYNRWEELSRNGKVLKKTQRPGGDPNPLTIHFCFLFCLHATNLTQHNTAND